MNRKRISTISCVSIISYITIIGWVISFISYNNGKKKSILAKYHLKQSFGLGVLGTLLIIIIITMIIVPITLSILIPLIILSLGVFIISIFGIINAVNKKKAPLPLIGLLFIDRFHFIN